MTSLKNKNFLDNSFNKLTFWLAISFAFVNVILIITSSSSLIKLYGQENYARWIFYYHVPIAWNAGICFILAGFNSFLYLKTSKTKYDFRALSFAELGTLFGILILITGSFWAKSEWGVYWSWEARLTTTLILVLIYFGYFMIQKYGGAYEKTSINRSYISLMSTIMIPIIYYSVQFFKDEFQSHPSNGSYFVYGGLQIFFFSLLSFLLLLIFLHNYRVFHLNKNKESLK